MAIQYFCKNKDRWKKVKESDSINGIDYLEVASDDQRTLNIYFLQNLPGQPGGIPAAPLLTKDNIFIEGGVRIRNIEVTSATANQKILAITTNEAGDFSTYTLKVAASLTDTDIPPDGFDVQLTSIDFSLKSTAPTSLIVHLKQLARP